jgi:hypothetical protein
MPPISEEKPFVLPPPSWSVHDLGLLRADGPGQGEEALNQEEVRESYTSSSEKPERH